MKAFWELSFIISMHFNMYEIRTGGVGGCERPARGRIVKQKLWCL